MLNWESLLETAPMLVAGMAGIFLVMGVLILAVYALNAVLNKIKK